MKPLVTGLLALTLVGLSAAQRRNTFTGTITDSMCAADGHAIMRMGPTDAECTRMCVVAHGAEYVLLAGKTVYKLSDQPKADAFAGQQVRVVGSLDAKTQTILVDSISSRR